MLHTISEATVWEALRQIPDPELPPINLVDLGVIWRVDLDPAAGQVRVLLLPTFLGCPALELMRAMVRERLAELGLAAQVDVTLEESWSSDRISAEGRRKLAAAGIAPPGPAGGSAPIALLTPARCPHCGSPNTSLDNAFGPTLCRAIAYCRDCRQPFEQFKPL